MGRPNRLKVPAQWGFNPNARQMRLTADCDRPAARAMPRVLQWVALAGLAPRVRVTPLADLRAECHPKQRVLRAYAGVPVRDRDGRTVGSLCLFAPDPVDVKADEVDLMETLAPLLAPHRGF